LYNPFSNCACRGIWQNPPDDPFGFAVACSGKTRQSANGLLSRSGGTLSLGLPVVLSQRLLKFLD
jgi:hypothetical protein